MFISTLNNWYTNILVSTVAINSPNHILLFLGSFIMFACLAQACLCGVHETNELPQTAPDLMVCWRPTYLMSLVLTGRRGLIDNIGRECCIIRTRFVALAMQFTEFTLILRFWFVDRRLEIRLSILHPAKTGFENVINCNFILPFVDVTSAGFTLNYCVHLSMAHQQALQIYWNYSLTLPLVGVTLAGFVNLLEL